MGCVLILKAPLYAMTFQPLRHIPALALLIFALSLGLGFVLGDEPTEEVLADELAEITDGEAVQLAWAEPDEKIGRPSHCAWGLEEGLEAAPAVTWLGVEAPERVEPGEVFSMHFNLINSGNVALFGTSNGCDEAPLNFGTVAPENHDSVFAWPELQASGWLSANRLKLPVDLWAPGEEIRLSVLARAPEEADVYSELFRPLLEGQNWLGEPMLVKVQVGDASPERVDAMSYVRETATSGAALEGLRRNVEIDLSEQKMMAKFGDDIVAWTMPISSGGYGTRTPQGTYFVQTKADLHISGEPYYFRMPNWIGFHGDYGIHALPWLGTEDGAYWQEAEASIGVPVSHGCVRTLPEDSDLIYRFLDIGNKVWIHA